MAGWSVNGTRPEFRLVTSISTGALIAPFAFHIGSDFNYPHNRKFDGEYMKRLFDYAYQLSVKGYPWHKAPPGEVTRDHD